LNNFFISQGKCVEDKEEEEYEEVILIAATSK
jgi:hypothetical protein